MVYLLHVTIDVKEGRLTAVLDLKHVGDAVLVLDEHAALRLLEYLDERLGLLD